MSNTSFLLSVDIGGTFTDLVLYTPQDHQVLSGKVLTSYPNPAEAVLSGITDLLHTHNLAPSQVERVIHGTTLVTNALIERRGAKTALITTSGFRDALEIGNEGRYDLYDLGLVRPKPLVERRLRFETDCRMRADGQEMAPYSPEQVVQLSHQLKAAGVEAIGICLLHAYTNPVHELQTAESLRQLLPEIPLTLSHQVAPAMREYPRTSTVVANAYVQPLTGRYLQELAVGLRKAGIQAPLNIMLSNGGSCTVETARRFPIRLVESGPCGGALAGAFWGKSVGYEEVLAFDMGGTTAKAVLTEKGAFSITANSEVAHVHRFKKGSGLPLLVPMIHMIEIGAGGGSIAGISDLGLPKVGPKSAGSTPGPACYDRGGDQPTVTDADVLIGFVNPDAFAGGSIVLDKAAAMKAYDELGRDLGILPLELAWGIHELVNENMAAAARVHAAERGIDIRDYALVATGGAGPVHACGVAEKLGISRFVVPPLAGVGSAFGFFLAPVSFDFTRTYLTDLASANHQEIDGILTQLEEEGRAIVKQAGVRPEEISVTRSAGHALSRARVRNPGLTPSCSCEYAIH